MRELKHAVEHAVALAGEQEIRLSDLPGAVQGGSRPPFAEALPRNFKQAKERMTEAFERDFLTRALERHGGNITHAAEEIGMYRQQLQTKVNKLGIDLAGLRRTES